MSQVKLIVSNWKMNLNFVEAKKLIQQIIQIKSEKSKVKHIVCPQFLLIPFVSNLIINNKIEIGAQDCHFKKKGAFTGDNSIELIKKSKCKYVIVGHSERREYHKETNEIIRQKVDIIISERIKPILCIGESVNHRKARKYLQVLKEQLKKCIPEKLSEIIIAYEPIWAIGTGLTPRIEEILEVQYFIKNFLIEYKKIPKIIFLYGGSVDSNNFNKIINNSHIDGALIGGASLKIKEMKKILTFC